MTTPTRGRRMRNSTRSIFGSTFAGSKKCAQNVWHTSTGVMAYLPIMNEKKNAATTARRMSSLTLSETFEPNVLSAASRTAASSASARASMLPSSSPTSRSSRAAASAAASVAFVAPSRTLG